MQISAKDLGRLNTKSFCDRCFWITRHDRELPYQTPFAGIFSSIDSYTKAVVERYFKRTGKFPPWLGGIGNPKAMLKIAQSKFRAKVGETVLTGAPDALFQNKNGSYGIIDYKTARYTGMQDSLMPVYEVQLNGYALIAERLGMKPVESLDLVYFEPPAAREAEELAGAHTSQDGFEMPFSPKVLPVRKNLERVEALMEEAERIYSEKAPPKGARGCEDCAKLDLLIELAEDKPHHQL